MNIEELLMNIAGFESLKGFGYYKVIQMILIDIEGFGSLKGFILNYRPFDVLYSF